MIFLFLLTLLLILFSPPSPPQATFLIFVNFNPAIAFFHQKALEKRGLTETTETRNDLSLYPIPRNTNPLTHEPFVPFTEETITIPSTTTPGETEKQVVRKPYDRRHARALGDYIYNKTGVYFNEGINFGNEGDGWIRMNVGCSTQSIAEALERIRKLILDLLKEFE